MAARGTYFRPELEALERRELPSTLGLSHRPIPINRTITGTLGPALTGLDLRIPRLRLGPLTGHATLTAFPTDANGGHAGTLVFRTNPDVGRLTFSDTGTLNRQAMTFTESVTVGRGTGVFHRARGQLTINGSFDLAGRFSATVVGQITP